MKKKMKSRSPQSFTPFADTRINQIIGLSLLLATLLVSCSMKDLPPPLPVEEQIERLKEIQARNEEEILALPGVLGIGIGRSETELLFSILVDRSKKVPELPMEIEGVPVRVQLRDPIRLLNGFPDCGDSNECHSDQQSLPVEMGNSGGWTSMTGGEPCTLGFKACDLGSRKLVFVTTSHCNDNSTTCELQTPGNLGNENWLHPARDDTDNPSTCISAGSCSVIGKITGHAAPECGMNNNFVDATKVESSSAQTSNAFRDIGFAQAGSGNPMMGDLVRISSRTTGDTFGEITNINISPKVPFCCGKLTMKGQIEWLPTNANNEDSTFLKRGDSGSALLSNEPRFKFQVVGLNFAVTENRRGKTHNYANHIDNVLTKLNLSLNFVSCFEDCLFTTMASALPDPETAVSLGHRFREQVLEKLPRGRRYANIYYQITDEAVRIVAANPGLLARTAKIFQRERPVIKALLKDNQVDISRTDLVAIDGLLKEYQKYGSPSMQTALDVVRKDLYDREALAEFNVTVK